MPICYRPTAVAAVLLLSVVFTACSPFKAMEYRGIDNWNLKPVSFSESILSARVSIYNPNEGRVKVKQLQSLVQLGTQQVGELKLDSTFIVPGKSVFTLPLQLKINPANLLKQGLGLAEKGTIEYRLNGFIKGKYKGLPGKVSFDYAGNFSVREIFN
jgi:LEA14-like dessication related protein